MSDAVQAPLGFSRSIVDWLVRFGFDGVDLDWRWPVVGDGAGAGGMRPEDCLNCMAFVQQLRRQLDRIPFGKRYTISMTVGPDAVFFGGKQCLDWRTLPTYVDFVNVQAYDLALWWPQSVTGHMAPMSKRATGGDDQQPAHELAWHPLGKKTP